MVSSFWATGQRSLPTWSTPFTSGGFHRTPLCLSLLIRPFQGLLPTSSSEVSLKLFTWFKFSLAGSKDLRRSRELAGRLLPWGILGKAEVLSVQGRQGTFEEVWPLSQSNLIESLNPITCLPRGEGGTAPVKRNRWQRERGTQILNESLRTAKPEANAAPTLMQDTYSGS